MFILCLGLLSCAPKAPAVPPPSEAAQIKCVAVADIAEVEILSDVQMKFHMRDGGHLLMDLPALCPSLAASGQFTFAPEKSRLCAGDGVQVVGPGAAPQRTASCALGHFRPQTPDFGSSTGK